MNINILKTCGVNYENGVERFLGDSVLYENMLKMFLEDDSFSKAVAALAEGNYKKLFESVHSIKGVAGNIDIDPLFKSASQLT